MLMLLKGLLLCSFGLWSNSMVQSKSSTCLYSSIQHRHEVALIALHNTAGVRMQLVISKLCILQMS